jgi:hypothetical protein
MTTAKRVRGTPRRTASKIKAKPVATREKSDLHKAKAFRDLESPMRELFCMAEITMEATMNITRGDENEIIAFAVSQLCDMIREMRAKYRADLHAVPARGKAVA